jgi:hypothetical protein
VGEKVSVARKEEEQRFNFTSPRHGQRDVRMEGRNTTESSGRPELRCKF